MVEATGRLAYTTPPLSFRGSIGDPSSQMNNKPVFIQRFDELTSEIAKIESTLNTQMSRQFGVRKYVDGEALLEWSLKARHLINEICGPESEHYKQFIVSQSVPGYGTNYDIMKNLRAVFNATKHDFEKGYLNSVRNLIQAEVFSTELDQAKELLSNGYVVASAVIAGVVLETSLRQMCIDASIHTGKLDKMNVDLCKAGVYNLFVQKRITSLADIRNNAAHGHPDKFGKSDVQDMISYIESFMAERLS